MHSYAGFFPAHNKSHYQKVSSTKESQEVADYRVAVADILVALKVILTLRHNIPDLSGKAGGKGTDALMSEYILG